MTKITITSRQLEDFIWMSSRYCIGRHTIAAACHAETIAKVINNNPNILSKERIEFAAVDIRRCINDAINWRDSVLVTGCRDMDAFSAVLYKSNEKDDPANWKYEVDTSRKEVYIDKPMGALNSKFDDDYIDLIPWVKLANLLDKSCHRMVTTEYKGEVKTMECYPFPLRHNGKYIKAWADVNNSDISINRWISAEFITKIEELKYEDKD